MFTFRRDPDARLGVGVAFTSAALDLGDRQDAAARSTAYARLSDALGVPVCIAAQVHGTDVLTVEDEEVASGLIDLTAHRADALVTDRPGVALAVRVADCVPICIAAADASAVAAVHAGRKGLLGGVIASAVTALRGLTDADLVAWVGPHVCGTCYEVPHEMAVDASQRLGLPVPATHWGTEGIDLGGATRRQLEALGVAVTDVSACTIEDARLHSHRRDDGAAGRMVGLVWIDPEGPGHRRMSTGRAAAGPAPARANVFPIP